jgi:hypothetical protein
LEDENEEEDGGVDFGDNDSGPDDETVGSSDAETEQHHGNAGFDGHVGKDVDWFTAPPPLSEEGQI